MTQKEEMRENMEKYDDSVLRRYLILQGSNSKQKIRNNGIEEKGELESVSAMWAMTFYFGHSILEEIKTVS